MRKKGAAYLPALSEQKSTLPILNCFFHSVQQCLQLMTELDDELDEWLEMDDAEDDLEEE